MTFYERSEADVFVVGVSEILPIPTWNPTSFEFLVYTVLVEGDRRQIFPQTYRNVPSHHTHQAEEHFELLIEPKSNHLASLEKQNRN